MKFGQIKTFIENQLLESYNDKVEFKKILNEFKSDILKNKNISKIYSLYDDLSTPQGLNEKDAMLFVNEGIELIQKFLPNVHLPEVDFEGFDNKYEMIDKLVYTTGKNINLIERLSTKKEIVEVLMKEKVLKEGSVKIPISTMLNVANKSLNSYLKSLDESTRNEVLQLLSEDTKSLKIKFESLKKDAKIKLNDLISKENDTTTKHRLLETITKIEVEKFNQLSFIKLKKLVESL